MKTFLSPRGLVLALSLGVLGLASTRVSAQTIINAVPYTITASGHYQLGGNLSSSSTTVAAITITAPNVDLDLNGYYVAGPGNSSLGNDYGKYSVIAVKDVANVTIRNGTVSSAVYGISFSSSDAANRRNFIVENVVVTRCYIIGIVCYSFAPGSAIRNCTFTTIGNSTFAANVYAYGTSTQGGFRIEKNNVGDVTSVGTGISYGISAYPADTMIGNTIANCTVGISGGKSLNNLTYNVTTPFQGTTNATGNN